MIVDVQKWIETARAENQAMLRAMGYSPGDGTPRHIGEDPRKHKHRRLDLKSEEAQRVLAAIRDNPGLTNAALLGLLSMAQWEWKMAIAPLLEFKLVKLTRRSNVVTYWPVDDHAPRRRAKKETANG